MKTAHEIAKEVAAEWYEYGPPEEGVRSGWLETGSFHDMIVAAIEVYREEIIRDMAEQAHPDDWCVPCVYVKSYAGRLRGEGA